ncbi:ATP-sensitive inward rectifier potassium channel 1-like [Panonychus citri]|uniref:ATP-sensitive inward rectifier potassium channel 1-like n=1 Tax=Panonychus citri TaxID=50023 RepID=UPI002307225A|nr:ATP-sensitive inward rectifier potassium channel 1-like [Panonychus citri]
MSDSNVTTELKNNSSDLSLITSNTITTTTTTTSTSNFIDETIEDNNLLMIDSKSCLPPTPLNSRPPNGYPKGLLPTATSSLTSTITLATLFDDSLLPTTPSPPPPPPPPSSPAHRQSPYITTSNSSSIYSHLYNHNQQYSTPIVTNLSTSSSNYNQPSSPRCSGGKFWRFFRSSSPNRHRQRVVFKNGGINLCKEHIEKRSRRYLQDTFTTMVDLRWRYNLLVFTLGFVLSWLLFASIWYVVAYFHDDLGESVPHERCVIGVNSFITAFLFSFESQHTIGFGNRYPHENCVEGIFFMCFQSIFGVMIECFVVGFVFAKLSRPKKRSQTLIFSRNAVVNVRDGSLCLVFRVGDVRARSYIIGASVSALLISRKISSEGEILPYYHESLKVHFDSCGTSVFLVWPATIYHVIDETSPFYSMDPEALANSQFEIVAMLKGTVESTGQTIEARTSYLPEEITWGRRFERLIDFQTQSGVYRVDYSKFDSTYEISTPKISARQFDQQQQQHQQQQQQPSYPNNQQQQQQFSQQLQRTRRSVAWNQIEDHNRNKVVD